jgi:hypothetical protein
LPPNSSGAASPSARHGADANIEKYLGSGMIRGIAPVYAKKLVRAAKRFRNLARLA